VTTERECDQLLVDRVREGDKQAFDLLVAKYQRRLMRLLSRIVHDPAEAEDVVQETFIKAYRALRHFRGDSAFYTWLYRIAVNTAIKHRSRHRNDTALSLSAEDLNGGLEALHSPADADPAQGGDPFRAAHRREREALIRRAVSALPEKQRAVVVLHYFEGLSCEEISRVVDCSVGTVWSRLHYACKRLKGVLETAEGVA